MKDLIKDLKAKGYKIVEIDEKSFKYQKDILGLVGIFQNIDEDRFSIGCLYQRVGVDEEKTDWYKSYHYYEGLKDNQELLQMIEDNLDLNNHQWLANISTSTVNPGDEVGDTIQIVPYRVLFESGV